MIAWMLGPESPRTLALIRLGIGLLVLHDALATWRFSVEMYSSAGPAMPAFSTRPPDSRSESAGPADTSTAPRQQIPGNITGWFVPPPLVAVAAQTLLVFSALAVAVGWKTCPSLLLTMALVAWLRPLDLSWTFAKYTIIWLHMLGLLAWGQSGGMLALDSRQRQPARVNGPALPRRLLQLLACQVYLGAAITKLKSPWFVGGELLQFSLLDRGWGGTWLGHLLATSSLGMRALSIGTILFELLFPFLVWAPRYRWAMLTLAGLFHLGVWATMHVGDFSPTMLVLLLAFIEPHELARFWQGSTIQSSDRSEALPGAAPVADGAMRHEAAHAPEKPPSRALRSFGTYLLTAAGVVLAGTGLQWWFDWYGVFGNRRMQPLDEAPAVVAEVMQTRRKPAFEDYVHRIALGTWRGERDVLGDGQRVRIGERLHVLVQFVVPHPDLKLEGLLLASDGRLAARFEHKLDAGYSYAINGFELTAELPTGTSRVILQIDGYEIASRKIEIEAAL